MMISKKLILSVIALALILGYLFWKYSPNLKTLSQSGPITLNLWSLEDERIYKKVVDEYNSTHPNTKVVYNQQNSTNYRTRIQTQLRGDQGPDIFWLHSSWVKMFQPDLAPAPTGVFNDFTTIFYPIAKESLSASGKVLAAPLELDGLALYVNVDILAGVGADIPTTWKEFTESAVTATVKNQIGQIQTAGAGMGTTSNVDFWSDIIGLLFYQQPKADLTKPASVEGAEVLKFYTNYITDPQSKVWDSSLPSTTQMFVDGKLAFYLAPASQLNVIKAANPNLNFKVTPVPQLTDRAVAWGSFAALGVSNYSPNYKAAWEFLEYLSQEEVQRKLYTTQIELGITPKVYPRIDLAQELINDPYLGAYVAQGPYYKGWYLNYQTLDAGINDEMIDFYKKALEQVLTGGDPQSALNSIQPSIQATLDKYSRSSQSP